MPRGTRFSAVVSSLATAILLALVVAGCDQGKSDQKTAGPAQGPPAPQVTIALPEKREVQEHEDFIGRFVPIDFVEVRARVSGYLDAIHFKDGEIVSKGTPLFSIDRRPFQTALDQSTSSLEQARANLAFAESDLKRAGELVRGSSITQQTFEQRQQARRVAEAAVELQQASIRQAKLDLGFTELTAPVSGRIGDRRVSVGNLVTGGTTGNTTLLATIASVDPIRFEFTLDEATYLRYMRLAGTAHHVASVPVKLKLMDETSYARDGRLDFVDNAIDRSSGTIRARAEVANADGLLTPGMFAHVQLAVGPPVEALLVPDGAIGSEQSRKFVLTIDAENVARPQYVTLGPVVGNMRVIKTGLKPDDRVIVNGLMRVRPGTKVAAQTAQPQVQTSTTPAPGPASPDPKPKLD